MPFVNKGGSDQPVYRSNLDGICYSHAQYFSINLDSLALNRLQSNLDSSNTDGSFTMANSNSFFSRKQIFREIFLFYREIVCCVHSLELPHQGSSNEYTQHTIIV